MKNLFKKKKSKKNEKKNIIKQKSKNEKNPWTLKVALRPSDVLLVHVHDCDLQASSSALVKWPQSFSDP